jgi:glycosyltransferase involved in cell wall biosynthesis
MIDRAPLVTVIIIVFDGVPFLDEAIASVRAQSFDDWELIVVDDGSTDRSVETAERHASDEVRISVLRHPDGGNHGISATRNLGLRHARGELVGFLDADDVWEPRKLEEQVAAFDQHPDVAMVYGRTLIWHSWHADRDGEDFFYGLGVEADRVHRPPTLFRQLLRNEHQTPTTCNALLRSRVCREVGGFEDSFRAMFEDQVFFSKVLLAHPVYVSGQCWAKYRQHPASTSALSGAAADEAAQVGFLRWLRDHLSDSPDRRAGDRLAVEAALLRIVRRRIRRRVPGGYGPARR